MDKTLTLLTDVCGLNRRRCVQCTLRAVCEGSFSAAFSECLWPLVPFDDCIVVLNNSYLRRIV